MLKIFKRYCSSTKYVISLYTNYCTYFSITRQVKKSRRDAYIVHWGNQVQVSKMMVIVDSKPRSPASGETVQGTFSMEENIRKQPMTGWWNESFDKLNTEFSRSPTNALWQVALESSEICITTFLMPIDTEEVSLLWLTCREVECARG